MKIQYLKNSEIDIELWDDCVKQSLQGFPYAYSFYLNIVAPGFSGVILNNYEAILPLPTKSKFGIKYVFRPLLCQQLGIVTKKKIEETTIKKMINCIPKEIRYINYGTSGKLGNTGSFTPKNNYILHLNKPYPTNLANYKYNTRRGVKIALKQQLKFVEDIPASSIIELMQQTFDRSNLILNDENYTDLKCLLDALYANKLGNSLGIFDERNELIAVVYYIKTGKRIINLINASTAFAKKNNSVMMLIDQVIKKYSDTNYIFDFEGSNIPSVARFFRSFGSEKTEYYNWCWNRLPFPFNYLKRNRPIS